MSKDRKRSAYLQGIPETWETKRLGELVDRVTVKYSDMDEDRYIPVNSVTNSNGFVPSDDQFDRTVYSEEVDDYKVVESGQFAYNPSRIDVGSISCYEGTEQVLVSPMYEVFEPKQEVSIDYLKFVLNTEWAKAIYRAYSQGSVRQTLKFDLFKDIPIPFPTVNERKWITDDLLPKFQQAVSHTENIIDDTRRVRSGILQDLFTEMADVDDYRAVELGPFEFEVPAEWSLVRLEDINEGSSPICYGVVKPGPEAQDGILLFNVEDVTEDGRLDLTNIDEITEGVHEKYYRSRITGGELLVTVRASVGKVVQVPEDIEQANISRGLARISPKKEVDPRWLRNCLRTPIYQKLMNIYASGTTYSQLNIEDLKKIPVVLPPKKEQIRISNNIEKVDNKIDTENKRLDRLESIAESVKYDLLTGNVRTKIETEV